MKKIPGQNSHTKPKIFRNDLKKKWVEPIRKKKTYKFFTKGNKYVKKKKKEVVSWRKTMKFF